MNLKEKIQLFRKIVNEMADLYEKKNSNYGDSFGQLYDELGAVAGLVPLWNKLHRATSLIKGDENHFESLEDTFKDLACYAIMNLIEMKAQKNREVDSVEDWKDYSTAPNIILEDNRDIGFWNPNPIDPCEGCETKKMLSKGLTYVGDLPCQWCSKNPYQLHCGTYTTTTDADAVNYIIRAAELGEENNEK